MIGEGRTGKIEGILRVLPGRDGRLSHAIPVVRRVVDRKRNICRRSVFRRNGLHHVLLSEPFRGGLIVSQKSCRVHRCRRRKGSVLRYPIGTKSRGGLAATNLLPEPALEIGRAS